MLFLRAFDRVEAGARGKRREIGGGEEEIGEIGKFWEKGEGGG